MGAKNLIELIGVSKVFPTAIKQFTALRAVDLQIKTGEFVAVVGRSGSGKSTLLNILSGIDLPTSGEIFVNETPLHRMNQDQMSVWRGKNVGIVFQFFQLLPTLSVIENVMLPMDFCNSFPGRERRHRASTLLEQFGIADQADKLPATLSGGEQQRAAMARALANDPLLIVADEPTGNLDSKTALSVIQLFNELSVAGKTIVMVTHERDIAAVVDRVIRLEDGQIVNGVTSHANSLE